MGKAEKKKVGVFLEYILFSIDYTFAFLLSRGGHVYLAGILLMLTALLLYGISYGKTKNLVNLKGLFSLSWIGGEGLACLQLSRLQSDWEWKTWLCFFLAYFCFMVGNTLSDCICCPLTRRGLNGGSPEGDTLSDTKYPSVQSTSNTGSPDRDDFREKRKGKDEVQAKRIMGCILFLGTASAACFLLEAVVLGFIPLFSPEPHAYSYFHITGVHYFTISCILIPALSVLYVRLTEEWNWFRIAVLALGNLLAAAIPILCVSRFQLLFAVGFAAVVYLMLYRHITWKLVVGALVILIPVYVLLTFARRHDVEYLNGIFEMKYSKMPIFITQPYIYVVNNYENFNCMVKQLPAFSGGVRMLFPFFALTGLKFLFPQLTTLPAFTTKEELTTLTLFYDAYYDFGVVGIILFAFVLGALAAGLARWVQNCKNPVVYLFYGQIAIYLGLSFFTTWFSNPTTWFWLALTVAMYMWVGYDGRKIRKKERKRGPVI